MMVMMMMTMTMALLTPDLTVFFVMSVTHICSMFAQLLMIQVQNVRDAQGDEKESV